MLIVDSSKEIDSRDEDELTFIDVIKPYESNKF